MTDVVRNAQHPTPRLGRAHRWVRPVAVLPLLAVVTVCLSTVGVPSRPAAADPLADARAKASQIAAELESNGRKIDALSQQYAAARYKIEQLKGEIAATKAEIARDRDLVAQNQRKVRKAAINAYINDGATAASNPLFATNTKEVASTQVYGEIAVGDLASAIANLNTAQRQLSVKTKDLKGQQAATESAAAAASAALRQAQGLQARQQATLGQVRGNIANLIAQQQRAQAAAQAQQAQQAISRGPSDYDLPPPPSDPRAAAAVAFAESMLGVPYVWGGASRSGVDCSGLTMLAWAAAGVSLPHFSGAQMANTTPVPISAIEPGDLLFYGPGGSAHVSIYIGGGKVIAAPYTGAYVRVEGANFGGNFVGARRP